MENPHRTLERKAIWLLWKGLTPAQVAKSTGLSYYWLSLVKDVYSKPLPNRDGTCVGIPAVRSVH